MINLTVGWSVILCLGAVNISYLTDFVLYALSKMPPNPPCS